MEALVHMPFVVGALGVIGAVGVVCAFDIGFGVCIGVFDVRIGAGVNGGT